MSSAGEARLRWRLLQIPIAKPAEFRTLDTIHYGMVTAFGASRDGTRLASADLEGKLYLWDLARGGPPESLSPGGIVLSLGFSPDGRTLVVGTAGDGAGRKEPSPDLGRCHAQAGAKRTAAGPGACLRHQP